MEIDPYFILGVSKNDSLEKITQEFKKQAKRYHPDKSSGDKEEASYRFKIIMDAYKMICNNIKRQTEVGFEELKRGYSQYTEKCESEYIEPGCAHPRPCMLGQCRIGEPSKFIKPNDFGYEIEERLGESVGGGEDMDPSKVNWEAKMSEYNKMDLKPNKVMESFNPLDFNRMFEYNNQQSDVSEVRGLIHRTTDGFMAANSDALNFASVSSAHGLMIIGDDYGESGVGYDAKGFSDYKKSHSSAKNPKVPLKVPGDYKASIENVGVMDQKMIESKIREHELERERVLKYDKSYSELSNEMDKKQNEMLSLKDEQDIKMIEKYAHIYPETVLKRMELDRYLKN